jgi:hypothetical protein
MVAWFIGDLPSGGILSWRIKAKIGRKKFDNKPVAQPVTQPVCYIITKPNIKSIGLMKMSQNSCHQLKARLGS